MCGFPFPSSSFTYNAVQCCLTHRLTPCRSRAKQFLRHLQWALILFLSLVSPHIVRLRGHCCQTSSHTALKRDHPEGHVHFISRRASSHLARFTIVDASHILPPRSCVRRIGIKGTVEPGVILKSGVCVGGREGSVCLCMCVC